MPYNALGTAMLSFSAQNKGAGLYERLKKGTTQSFVLMGIMYVATNLIGLLLCINGAFVYLFLSASSIYPQTIFYATDYFYIVLPLSFILGALFIGRNVVQGLGKPLFPFLAGIGELAARLFACAFLPSLISPNNPTSNVAFAGVCLADPLAWTFACFFLVYGLIHYVYQDHIEDHSGIRIIRFAHHLEK